MRDMCKASGNISSAVVKWIGPESLYKLKSYQL